MRSGVGLVFASEALGLSHIIEAHINMFCRPICRTGRKSPERRSLHRFQLASICSNGSYSIVRNIALTNVQLGVLFFFDPRATWSWLSLPPDERTMLEGHLKSLISPGRWNTVGIHQRLAQHGKLDTGDTCEAILRAIRGWPSLLDVLFYRCGTQQDPGPTAETIRKEFQEKHTKSGQQFRHCLGLWESDSTQRVLAFIWDGQPVALNHVTPKAIGGEPTLSSSAC